MDYGLPTVQEATEDNRKSLKKEMNKTSISPVSQYQSKVAADSTICTLFDSLKDDPLFPLFQQLFMQVTASDYFPWNEFYILVFQLFFFLLSVYMVPYHAYHASSFDEE